MSPGIGGLSDRCPVKDIPEICIATKFQIDKEDNAMEKRHDCQSCGMPVTAEDLKGTRKDGSLTDEFCTYCYQKGAFTQDVSMGEMVEICVPHLVNSGMQEADARKLMQETLPKLSRWK